jgi:hypothetical protein
MYVFRNGVSSSMREGLILILKLKLNYDQFFFLLKIFFRQLRICYFIVPPLTRGWVCDLLLLLVLTSAVPHDSRPYFIVQILETSPTWRTRSQFLYPSETEWPSYTPEHWVPFPSPLTTHRAMVEVFYPDFTRKRRSLLACLHYIASVQTTQKILLPTVLLLLHPANCGVVVDG